MVGVGAVGEGGAVVGGSIGGAVVLQGLRQIVPRSVGVPDAAVTQGGLIQMLSKSRGVPDDHCNG